MKSISLILGITLVFMLSAHAKPKMQPERRIKFKDMPSVQSKVYKRFDRNNDGTLDEKEVKAIREAFRLNPNDTDLQPYDRDDDKRLSDEEIAGIPRAEIDHKELEKMKAKSAKGKKRK